MDRTNHVSAVVLFVGTLLSSTADDQRDSLEWLAGPSGQRLAVALADIIDLHRPDTAGRCPDCRLTPSPTVQTCRTWNVLVRALAGLDETWLGREHRRLRIRYASEPQ
jgi:hypothetical protein